MVFTKTVVHQYSKSSGLSFEEFVRGTLFLLNYTTSSRINLRVNIQDPDLLQYVIVNNYDTYVLTPTALFYTDSYKKSNMALLRALDSFSTSSSPLFVVTTNAFIDRKEVSVNAYLEFSNLIGFPEYLYNDAKSIVANDLLNHSLFSDLVNGYSVIYVNTNDISSIWAHKDIKLLARQIWESLDFTRPIVVISNNSELKELLTELLTNIGRLLESSLEVSIPNLEYSIPISIYDSIINYLILLNSKKIYSFSEYYNSPNKKVQELNLCTVAETMRNIVGSIQYSSVALFYTTLTIAGEGPIFGSSELTPASFNSPTAINADSSGNIYVSDTGNHVIRKITPAGLVTTFAGTGNAGYADGPGTSAQFSSPYGIWNDKYNVIYVADQFNNRIRKIMPNASVSTVAGDGNAGFLNGPVFQSEFNRPCGITIDTLGNLYIADTNNNRIRKISNGIVTTFAGSGVDGLQDGTATTTAEFSLPYAMLNDGSDNIFVVDQFNSKIRYITPGGIVSTFEGNIYAQGQEKAYNVGINLNGVYYVADSSANKVLKNVNGVSTVFSGNGVPALVNNYYITGTNPGPLFTFADTIVNSDGSIVPAILYKPYGVAVDSSRNIYFTDTSNNRVRKTTLAGIVSTIAGKTNTGFEDAKGSQASFNSPTGICVDSSGILYIADTGNNAIRRIDTSGNVETFCSSLLRPSGVAVDSSGIIYVTDTGNSRVCKIISGGTLIEISNDFNSPVGITLDRIGTIYVTDQGSNCIKKIYTNGRISIVCKVYSPTGIAINARGDIYITENTSNAIKKYTSNGILVPLSGSPLNIAGLNDGVGPPRVLKEYFMLKSIAQYNNPSGLAIDSSGTLYIADTGNNMIRKIIPTFSKPTMALPIDIQYIHVSRTNNSGLTLGPSTAK